MSLERAKFIDIIENEKITTFFQPIVSLETGDVFGYEALSRGPEGTSYFSPLKLLEVATQQDLLWELEVVFRKKAIQTVSQLNIDKKVFINVDPNIINDKSFLSGFTTSCLNRFNVDKSLIVFEITERTRVHDMQLLSDMLKHYSDQGFQIALDDSGAGYSNFLTIVYSRPDYIKIDQALIHEVDYNYYKQAMIGSLVSFAQLTGAKVIAEGIETAAQLKAVIKLGVHAGQGYYLQRPQKELRSILPERLEEIEQYNQQYNFLKPEKRHRIGEIAQAIEAYDYLTPCVTIKEKLENSILEGICLVSNDVPVGLVMKTHLDAVMSLRYGYSVFANRSANKIMDTHCTIVDYNTPIEEVSRLAMARSDNKIYNSIIVTENYKYYGMVTINRLLKFLIDSERNLALQSNPLTSLPGNYRIELEMQEIRIENEHCCLLYFDLDDFKPYNDTYGFSSGDEMIKMTGQILCRYVENNAFRGFVGHIGGDDFICILYAPYEVCVDICQKILQEFNRKVLALFSLTDREKGYYFGIGRDGLCHQYNLTSLSGAGLYGTFKHFNTIDEISRAAAQIKSKAKKVPGSYFVIEDIEEKMRIFGI